MKFLLLLIAGASRYVRSQGFPSIEPFVDTCNKEYDKESSILDYLDPDLLDDDDALREIKSSLLDGELVVIRDAFKPDFAEYVWNELNRVDLNWTRSPIRGYSPGLPGHTSPKHRPSAITTELSDVFRMLDSTETKDFMEKLTGRQCSEKATFGASWYKPGDYSMQHNDYIKYRSISFVWNLSKEWDPSWGGAFYWESAESLRDGFHYPVFNTLLLFIPTMSSVHSVTPVTDDAKGKRLTLVGWYNVDVDIDGPSIKDPLEDMFGTKKDCTRLSQLQADWIVLHMDPQVESDESRREKLVELKGAVLKNCLSSSPSSDVLLVDSEEDLALASPGIPQSAAAPTSRNDESNFDLSLTLNNTRHSLLDYLDPDLLDDDDALREIKGSLLNGELVVIRDAFKADFAEYVWNELNREDIWDKDAGCSRSAPSQGQNFIPGHTGKKHRLASLSSNITTELLSPLLATVFRMLDSTETKDFMEKLTGRKSSGKNIMRSAWYKAGDHSMHHNDFIENRAVSFVWNLSKEWDPSWGGAFYWGPAGNAKGGFHYPTFNSLHLFIPRMSSVHSVTPVTDDAEGKRLTIYGWYNVDVNIDGPSIKDPLEDMFGTKKDCTRLSMSQADWIVRHMDPRVESDETRREKLVELKGAVLKNCLLPPSSEVLLVE